MRAYRYLKLNLDIAKQIYFAMLLVIVQAYIFSKTQTIVWGSVMLLIGIVCLYGATFMFEDKNIEVFIHMLPGSYRDRVIGKMMEGGVYLSVATISQLLIWALLKIKGVTEMTHIVELTVITFGIGLMGISIQTMLYYFLGKDGAKRIVVLMALMPLMISWIMIMCISLYNVENLFELIETVIKSIKSNLVLTTVGILIIGIASLGLSTIVSEKILEKKDYA